MDWFFFIIQLLNELKIWQIERSGPLKLKEPIKTERV